MKAMLASLVLSLALVFSPGLARADSTAPAANAPAELAVSDIDVTGWGLTTGFGQFTGKIKVKAFVKVNGTLKVKVALKGLILTDAGVFKPVDVDGLVIVVADIEASCDIIKLHLASIKVKVIIAGVGEVEIRLFETVIVLDASKCNCKDKFCRFAKVIHGKKNCIAIIKLLNGMCGFPHDDHDCDDDCDDCDDCDDDDGHGGGGGHGGGCHGGGGHGGGGHGGGGHGGGGHGGGGHGGGKK